MEAAVTAQMCSAWISWHMQTNLEVDEHQVDNNKISSNSFISFAAGKNKLWHSRTTTDDIVCSMFSHINIFYVGLKIYLISFCITNRPLPYSRVPRANISLSRKQIHHIRPNCTRKSLTHAIHELYTCIFASYISVQMPCIQSMSCRHSVSIMECAATSRKRTHLYD